MIVKQGNREFISITDINGNIKYYVHKIDNRWPIGRESSYEWIKCKNCGRIVGTQFNGYIRHIEKCKKE